METDYATKLKRYIYEAEKEGKKEYKLEELLGFSELELMNLMPPNKCIYESSPQFSYDIVKTIVCFRLDKTIDSQWILKYSEGHRDKPLKEQYVLFELRCKDLKIGLIDMYLQVQNYTNEWWNGVKSGRIKLDLSNWDT